MRGYWSCIRPIAHLWHLIKWAGWIVVVPPEDTRHYPARCSDCGWIGNSVLLGFEGGCDGDVWCPRCCSESESIQDWDNVYPWTYFLYQIRWYCWLKYVVWFRHRYWKWNFKKLLSFFKKQSKG